MLTHRARHGAAAPPAGSVSRRVRGRVLVALVAALTVLLAAVAVTLGVINAHRGATQTSRAAQGQASNGGQSLIAALTGIPPSVLAQVTDGGLLSDMTPLRGAPALTGADARPQLVYVAGTGCAACAVERWSLVVALSRFGSFQHLYLATAPLGVAGANVATFTFERLGYTSDYVDVAAVEESAGTTAQSPLSAQQRTLMSTYDAPPYVPATSSGGIPWLDVANRYVLSGGRAVAGLAGLNWGQVAQKLQSPTDPLARLILGDANVLTAAICRATGMRPAQVCSSAPVAGLAARLG